MAFKELDSVFAKTHLLANQASLRKGGYLYLPLSLLNEYCKNAKFAKIYVDNEKYLVGVKFLEKRPTDTNCSNLLEDASSKTKGRQLNFMGVMKNFGFKKVPHVFIFSTYSYKDMMVVDLSDYVKRSRSSNNQNKKGFEAMKL